MQDFKNMSSLLDSILVISYFYSSSWYDVINMLLNIALNSETMYKGFCIDCWIVSGEDPDTGGNNKEKYFLR